MGKKVQHELVNFRGMRDREIVIGAFNGLESQVV